MSEAMDDLTAARRLVAGAINRPVETVTDDGTVGRQAGWDSIGHVAIILAVEGELGRMLRPEEIGRILSVRDIAAMLAG